MASAEGKSRISCEGGRENPSTVSTGRAGAFTARKVLYFCEYLYNDAIGWPRFNALNVDRPNIIVPLERTLVAVYYPDESRVKLL